MVHSTRRSSGPQISFSGGRFENPILPIVLIRLRFSNDCNRKAAARIVSRSAQSRQPSSRLITDFLHHEGFCRRIRKSPLSRRAANPAARRPATTRQSQAPHVAPSRSSETAPQPCEQVQPQARAGCPAVEAHPRCTSRSLPRSKPTAELQAERGCFREDPLGLGRYLRNLPA